MNDADLRAWINKERAIRGLPEVKPFEDWLRRQAEKRAAQLAPPRPKFQVNSAARRRAKKRGAA